MLALVCASQRCLDHLQMVGTSDVMTITDQLTTVKQSI